MQTEPIAYPTSVATIEAAQSRIPTTQDGLCPAEPRLLEAGGSPPPRDAPLPSEGTPRRVRSPDGGFTLPGERIAAYENATAPTPPHTLGFKVVKPSGPNSVGLSLPDCPNGACARLLPRRFFLLMRS